MLWQDKIQVDDDYEPGMIEPEHDLFLAIIQRAILDASSKYNATLAREAIDFLFTNRLDPYAHMIGADPQELRDGILKAMKSYQTRVAKRGDVNRRNFIINYERFHGKPFVTNIPMDVLYSTVMKIG